MKIEYLQTPDNYLFCPCDAIRDLILQRGEPLSEDMLFTLVNLGRIITIYSINGTYAKPAIVGERIAKVYSEAARNAFVDWAQAGNELAGITFKNLTSMDPDSLKAATQLVELVFNPEYRDDILSEDYKPDYLSEFPFDN